MSQLEYIDMASCISWSNNFSPSATDFEFFTNIWDWLCYKFIFEENLSHLWLWVHCGMLSDSVLKMLQKGKGLFFRVLL
jgi:hypothetical protein